METTAIHTQDTGSNEDYVFKQIWNRVPDALRTLSVPTISIVNEENATQTSNQTIKDGVEINSRSTDVPKTCAPNTNYANAVDKQKYSAREETRGRQQTPQEKRQQGNTYDEEMKDVDDKKENNYNDNFEDDEDGNDDEDEDEETYDDEDDEEDDDDDDDTYDEALEYAKKQSLMQTTEPNHFSPEISEEEEYTDDDYDGLYDSEDDDDDDDEDDDDDDDYDRLDYDEKEEEIVKNDQKNASYFVVPKSIKHFTNLKHHEKPAPSNKVHKLVSIIRNQPTRKASLGNVFQKYPYKNVDENKSKHNNNISHTEPSCQSIKSVSFYENDYNTRNKRQLNISHHNNNDLKRASRARTSSDGYLAQSDKQASNNLSNGSRSTPKISRTSPVVNIASGRHPNYPYSSEDSLRMQRVDEEPAQRGPPKDVNSTERFNSRCVHCEEERKASLEMHRTDSGNVNSNNAMWQRLDHEEIGKANLNPPINGTNPYNLPVYVLPTTSVSAPLGNEPQLEESKNLLRLTSSENNRSKIPEGLQDKESLEQFVAGIVEKKLSITMNKKQRKKAKHRRKVSSSSSSESSADESSTNSSSSSSSSESSTSSNDSQSEESTSSEEPVSNKPRLTKKIKDRNKNVNNTNLIEGVKKKKSPKKEQLSEHARSMEKLYQGKPCESRASVVEVSSSGAQSSDETCANSEVLEVHAKAIRSDGKYRFFDCRFEPIKSDQKRALVGSQVQSSHQKQAEELYSEMPLWNQSLRDEERVLPAEDAGSKSYSDNSVANHHQRLGESLKNLQNLKDFADLIVEVEGVSFKVHRLVVVCQSDFFRRLLRKGVPPDGVAIDNIAPSTFESILNYLYTGEIKATPSNVGRLSVAAHKLEISDLETFCSRIVTNLSLSEVLVAISKDTEAIKMLPSFQKQLKRLNQNFSEAVQLDEFLSLPLETLCLLLDSEDLIVSSELEIANAALRWIDSDRPNRVHQAERVLGCIRFRKLSQEQLVELYRKDSTIFGDPSILNLIMEATWLNAFRKTEKTASKEKLLASISASIHSSHSDQRPKPRRLL